jgi:hypothetical protein
MIRWVGGASRTNNKKDMCLKESGSCDNNPRFNSWRVGVLGGGGFHDHLLNTRISTLIIDKMFIYEYQKYEECGLWSSFELANHLVLIACSISLERVG